MSRRSPELIFNTRDIRPEGQDVIGDILPEDFGFSKDDYLTLTKPVHVEGRIYKADEAVLADVVASTRFHTYCSRTLVEIDRDWQVSLQIDCEGPDTNGNVDLGEDVRQEVLIRLPTRVLAEGERDKEFDPTELGLSPEALQDDEGAAGPEEKFYRPFADLTDINEDQP